IDSYFDVVGDQIVFGREQSSDFAKRVAGDFNPLHDVNSKRFCVPGDLLFAVYLHRYGVSESMTFEFLNMVDAQVPLVTRHDDNAHLLIDAKDREYLSVHASGSCVTESQITGQLTQAYVQFSGQTFPYLLVDLMRNHQVMINPARPLVIYKSMRLVISRLEADNIALKFSGAELQRDGKKATVELNFDIFSDQTTVGQGQKQMVLGGLRDYDEAAMDALVQEYQAIKRQFSQASS
ncbi:MAG: DUF3581 family protein, partial [Pseudomonadota bacterium]